MNTLDKNLDRALVWNALACAFRPPLPGTPASTRDLAEAVAALGLDVDVSPLCGPAPREGYDAVFGHSVRGACPAYEGEYGEPKRFRFAHEISDVQGFYAAFGLKPSRRLPERSDHIAIECEFFGFLALKEACAAQAHGPDEVALCRDASRKFLAEHLGRFGRALAARVRSRARDPYYRAAADLLDAALRADAADLGVELGSHEMPLRPDAGAPEDACVRCGAFDEAPR